MRSITLPQIMPCTSQPHNNYSSFSPLQWNHTFYSILDPKHFFFSAFKKAAAKSVALAATNGSHDQWATGQTRLA